MIGLSILIDFSSIVEDVGHKLLPNWISFVVQVAALVIMILVIFFVAYKPVKKMLKKRQDYVVNNIKEAEASGVDTTDFFMQFKGCKSPVDIVLKLECE